MPEETTPDLPSYHCTRPFARNRAGPAASRDAPTKDLISKNDVVATCSTVSATSNLGTEAETRRMREFGHSDSPDLGSPVCDLNPTGIVSSPTKIQMVHLGNRERFTYAPSPEKESLWPLRNLREARLLQQFVTHLAPWVRMLHRSFGCLSRRIDCTSV